MSIDAMTNAVTKVAQEEYKRGLIDGRKQWVGLTEEEIFAAENSVPDEAITDRNWCVYFARAIEARLKDKNHA